MRKGACICLMLALFVLLGACSANAWIRSKMYDGNMPYDPQIPNAGGPGWGEVEAQGVRFVAGELVGPTAPVPDQRWAFGITCGENSKCKFRSNNQASWTIDPDAKTSIMWSIYIGGQTPGAECDRCPQVKIRLAYNGEMKMAYSGIDPGAITPTPAGVRGWYVQEGTIDPACTDDVDIIVYDDSSIPTYKTARGLAMEPGEWHTIRYTYDPTIDRWDFWVDDGLGGHIWGNADAYTGDQNYIQWGKIDRGDSVITFWTDYVYWGQASWDKVGGAWDEGQISPIGAAGISEPTVTLDPSGTSATIEWDTDVASDTRLLYDKDFYTWGNDVQIAESVTHHSVTINNLDLSSYYTFYCQSDDGQNAWATGVETFETPRTALPIAVGNPGFEQGCSFYPWVECVLPQTPEDGFRWGGCYNVLDTYFTAYNGVMWSGSTQNSYEGRDWATLAQQVSVTNGLPYLAKAWFNGARADGGHQYIQGRIGIDPTGTDPGTLDGSLESLNALPIVWGEFAEGAQWNEAVVLALAESDTITVFIQQHYGAPAGLQAWAQFDDVSIEEGPELPVTCADTKSWIVGYPVDLAGVHVTYKHINAAAVPPDPQVIGYVQDAVDRPAGIRVVADLVTWPDAVLGVGTAVDVVGVLEVNDDGELQIAATAVSAAAAPGANVHSMGLPGRSIGGGPLENQIGTDEGSGTNTIGLLVRTWGKVTGIEAEPPGLPSQPFSIFVDDGTGLTAGVDGSTTIYPGVEVKCFGDPVLGGMSFTVGDYVLVTGASSLKLWDTDNDPETNNSLVKPVILIRDADDIQFSGVD